MINDASIRRKLVCSVFHSPYLSLNVGVGVLLQIPVCGVVSCPEIFNLILTLTILPTALLLSLSYSAPPPGNPLFLFASNSSFALSGFYLLHSPNLSIHNHRLDRFSCF
ncbi:hypothetical protein VNO78_22321 [Psophocarpus tetragonolobus]|uniref:Uncharacterized protein n=1 Tax=Psophocarpus tetragonolobus TaxID=3891 RepID=A0AAN9XIC0_PSOTE